jgi:hypothetical protein
MPEFLLILNLIEAELSFVNSTVALIIPDQLNSKTLRKITFSAFGYPATEPVGITDGSPCVRNLASPSDARFLGPRSVATRLLQPFPRIQIGMQNVLSSGLTS